MEFLRQEKFVMILLIDLSQGVKMIAQDQRKSLVAERSILNFRPIVFKVEECWLLLVVITLLKKGKNVIMFT